QAAKLGAAGRAVGLPLLLAVSAAQLAWGEGLVAVALRDLALALVAVWLVQQAADGLGGAAGRLLSCRPSTYLCTVSYGIYVWHGLVPVFAERLGWPHYPESLGAGKFLYVTAAAVGLASLTWHLFEARLNGLKRYFPYSPRPA